MLVWVVKKTRKKEKENSFPSFQQSSIESCLRGAVMAVQQRRGEKTFNSKIHPFVHIPPIQNFLQRRALLKSSWLSPRTARTKYQMYFINQS